MARTRQKRKRSNGMFKRRTKRRRFGRRKRRSTQTYSSRSLTASTAFKPRSKKLSRRRYRSVLWRDSLMSTHYRSILTRAAPVALVTPANVTQINWVDNAAFQDNPNANAFYKAVGGAQDPSFGVAPDWMQAPGAGIPEPITIIIRGGRIFCNVANPSTTDTIVVRVQLIWHKQQFFNAADTAASTTTLDWLAAISAAGPRPISWDLQCAPDYHEYFYPPTVDKTMDLKPGDDLMVISKVKCTKIDIKPFMTGGGGWFPIWIVYAGQRVDTTAGAQAVTVTLGHNISFAVMDSTDV